MLHAIRCAWVADRDCTGSRRAVVRRYVQLACSKAFSGRILPMLALASLIGAVFFGICSVADADGDGKLSQDEVKNFYGGIFSALRSLGRPRRGMDTERKS